MKCSYFTSSIVLAGRLISAAVIASFFSKWILMKANPQLIFENLWQQKNTAYHAGVAELWKKHIPSFTDDTIEARLLQVAFAIRTSEGRIVGVSTAFRAYVEQLKHHLYAYRCFIDPAYRVPGLDTALTVKTRDLLEEIHLTDGAPEVRCVGMITLVENEHLIKHRNEAVWPASQMVYIGNSPKGYPIRVYYFKGAVI